MSKVIPAPDRDKIGGRSRWDVESDLRALRDSDKIKRDPKRTKAVNILVKEEMSALEHLAHEAKEGLGRSKEYHNPGSHNKDSY